MMDLKGKITSCMFNPTNRKYAYTFECDEYCELPTDKELSIKVAPYHKKRSLDANAYAWVLMSKLAEAMHTDKDSIYELMLDRYGRYWTNENGEYMTFTIPASADPRNIGIHSKFIGTHFVGEKAFKSYMLLKGSSDFDSSEMNFFLEGIIFECKQLGIQTETPNEIARMVALWKA